MLQAVWRRGSLEMVSLRNEQFWSASVVTYVKPTFLQGLSTKAGTAKAHRFQNLYGCLNAPLLHAAWRKLNKRGAPGVDKETVAQYEEHLDTNSRRLVGRLKRGEYRSRLIRRRYIPEGNGKERQLGIPVVEGRLLQGAARLQCEAIFEADFLPISYGCRPGVGAQQAVKDLTCELQFGRNGCVVEADIKGFFDTIDHDWLLRMIMSAPSSAEVMHRPSIERYPNG